MYKTKVDSNGGKTPTWNHTIEIPISSLIDELQVTCLDEDLTSNDIIGETKIAFSLICKGVK